MRSNKSPAQGETPNLVGVQSKIANLFSKKNTGSSTIDLEKYLFSMTGETKSQHWVINNHQKKADDKKYTKSFAKAAGPE